MTRISIFITCGMLIWTPTGCTGSRQNLQDVLEKHHAAGEIADGIIAVCGRLRSRFPEMKILLLGIFRREPGPCVQREKIAEAKRLTSRIADHIIGTIESAGIFQKTNY